MKFDVIVGNPPYSKGTVLLYRYFFERAMELGDIVSFVMPMNLESNYDSLKKLNASIKKHSMFISGNVSHYFNVGLNNIHYVICSPSIQNTTRNAHSSVFDQYTLRNPCSSRLSPIKGNTAVSDNKISDDNGIEIIDKILKGGKVVMRKVKPELAKNASQKITSEYGVFTNHTPSLGKLNVAIVKNPQTTWSMSVFAYEANTLNEATALKEWLQSELITNEIVELLSLKKTYAITLEMLRKLPNVK